MCDIFTYIWLISIVNVGKYTIHGSYWVCIYIYIYTVCIYIYFLQVKMTSFFNAEPLNG